MPGAWLILPTYNEAENIGPVVRAARAQLRDGDTILIVDDNSPDGTGRLADALAAELPNVRELHRPDKQALGRAYLAGFDEALTNGAAYLLEIDSDFPHDPKNIPRMSADAVSGADLILPRRKAPQSTVTDGGTLRKLVIR